MAKRTREIWQNLIGQFERSGTVLIPDEYSSAEIRSGPMSPDQARELLSFHYGTNPNSDDSRWQEGFLSTLRPYKGLRESVFHEVMACVETLAEELVADKIDRATLSSLWGICHFGRAWGVEEGGMLHRNGLITDADRSRLAGWIDCISYAVTMLLDGVGLEVALEPYRLLRSEIQDR